MNKYEVEIIAKQRYVIIVDATDEETAIQGTLDLIEENPDGYNTGLFDKALMGPEARVTVLKKGLT